MIRKLKLYIEFVRPFTLFPPAIGMVSGGITAFGAEPKTTFGLWILGSIALGTVMAATLNAASNCMNQIFDLELDRVNKPSRPIPSGRLSIKEAWCVSLLLYAAAIIMAWFVGPKESNRACFILVLIATFMTYAYSAPPFRTKRWGVAANLTIAIPRGVLLKVAGWSTVKSIVNPEAWYIGAVFGTFLLGASTTKDYADMEGDEKAGCITLPIRYGIKKSAYMISPFFVLPFLMLPIGAETGVLTGNRWLLDWLGLLLALWGAYTAYLIVRRPDELATTENHISWTHMYLMMMATQVGFAVAYLVA